MFSGYKTYIFMLAAIFIIGLEQIGVVTPEAKK